jgi:hypothetical protein
MGEPKETKEQFENTQEPISEQASVESRLERGQQLQHINTVQNEVCIQNFNITHRCLYDVTRD